MIEVGRANGPIDTLRRGHAHLRARIAAQSARDTIYDLASLTKVIATTALMAGEVVAGRMRLNDRVRHWIDVVDRRRTAGRHAARSARALRRVCPAHRHYFESRRGRASFELAICEEPLDYPPRSKSIYSDPGFMLLGFAIENAAGDAARSAVRSTGAIASSAPTSNCVIGRAAEWLDRIAPTENTPDGERAARRSARRERARRSAASPRMPDCSAPPPPSARAARWWMKSPSLPLFAAKTTVPGSSRALGWDTMLPTSSCGTKMSAERDRPHRIHRHVAVDRSRATICMW